MDDIGYPPMMPQRPSSSPIVAMPKEILEMIFNPSMVLEKIRHDLKGESGPYLKYVDKGTGKDCLPTDKNAIPVTYWAQNGQRDLNDQGVEAVMSMLNKYVNRNTFFTKLTDAEIYRITKLIARNLTAMFAAKYTEYEIDINRMSLVKEGIVDMIFLALKQSEGGKLIDAMTQLISVQETKDSSEKGFSVGDLSPFGGKR